MTDTAYRPRPHVRTKAGAEPRGGERKTHCINNHEFTPENTFRDKNGHRCCYACSALRMRRYRKRKAIKAWQERTPA